MVIVCLSCRHAIRVIGEPSSYRFLLGDASEYWPDKYRCARCNEECRGCFEPELDAAVASTLVFHNLLPEEAFAAINGLGFPSERNCVEEVIQKLFEEHKVRRVHGRQHPALSRFYVDSIEMDDGTKVYLSASPQGACVYRISAPHSYAEAVSNG